MPKDFDSLPTLNHMAKQLGIQRRLELTEEIADLKRQLQHQTYVIAVMVNMQGGRVEITRKDVEAVQTGMLHEHRDSITDSIILTMEDEVERDSNDLDQA